MSTPHQIAHNVARDRLISASYCRGTVDVAGRGLAAAEYVRSLIRQNRLGDATEALTEHADAITAKILSLLAQVFETSLDADCKSLGAYLGDAGMTYFAPQVDMIIDDLPTYVDITADDYDEERFNYLRETA